MYGIDQLSFATGVMVCRRTVRGWKAASGYRTIAGGQTEGRRKDGLEIVGGRWAKELAIGRAGIERERGSRTGRDQRHLHCGHVWLIKVYVFAFQFYRASANRC